MVEIRASNLKWEGLGSKRESMVEERWLQEQKGGHGDAGEEGFFEMGETTIE